MSISTLLWFLPAAHESYSEQVLKNPFPFLAVVETKSLAPTS